MEIVPCWCGVVFQEMKWVTESKLLSKLYTNILKILNPLSRKIKLRGFIFQRDNTAEQTYPIAKQCSDIKQIQKLEWSFQLSNLNSMEHL